MWPQLLGLLPSIFDKIWPDKTKADEAKARLLEIQLNGELDQIKGQLEINKEEAKSASVFVSGWRPAIGWVCAAALAFQYLARPLLVGFGFANQLPALDDTLWQLLFGMLGLGALRTVEKIKGAEGNR